MKFFKCIIPGIICFFIAINAWSGNNDNKTGLNQNHLISNSETKFNLIQKDSIPVVINNIDFNQNKRGFKPWIAPTLLISGGTAIHFMTGFKENIQDYFQKNLLYHGHFDDYAQYAPVVAVYALNLAGVKGKNRLGNRTAVLVKSILLNRFFVGSIKELANVKRPSGEFHSFPSGHTSMAFTLAHFMHREYGNQSVWYSIGAYTCASTVGLMRISKNAHWISDVFAGAGFGILSTEIAYFTHRYKWDKKNSKNLTISPFNWRNQNGLTMVYRF